MNKAASLKGEYDVVSRAGELLLQYTSHIAEALRSLMTGSAFPADVPITTRDADVLIGAGLGPIFFHVLTSSGCLSEIDTEMKFKASDITSRAMSAEQFKSLEFVLGLLRPTDIFPVLLKGASFASNYYPEPHQRIMGDIDLLLPVERVDDAERVLLSEGFTKADPGPDMNYDTHIHSAPLFHADRNIWIELHRQLLKSTFPPSAEVPLDLSTLQNEIRPITIGNLEARRFRTEFELVYLASYWCFDLTTGFARPGIQRGLFDATVILKSCQHKLNWDTVLRWSDNSLSGSCLYILLSFLERIGVFDDASNVCEALGKRQRFVNATTLNLMHKRIDKYLVQLRPFGPLTSPITTSNLFDALVRKRAAWKNLLSVPGNILFPSGEARRFELGYHVNRIRTAVSRER